MCHKFIHSKQSRLNKVCSAILTCCFHPEYFYIIVVHVVHLEVTVLIFRFYYNGVSKSSRSSTSINKCICCLNNNSPFIFCWLEYSDI